MKTKKITKTISPELNLGLKRHQQIQQRKEESQLLIQLADEKIEARFTDKYLDRENEKIKLRSGELAPSIKEMKFYVSQIWNNTDKKFSQSWYRAVFKLYGYPIPDGLIQHKPHTIALFTIQFIYGRFPKEILRELQQLNPYIEGVRLFKHYQRLTQEAEEMLVQYIKDSESLMNECKTLHEFSAKYGQKYGIPFQWSLLDNNFTS